MTVIDALRLIIVFAGLLAALGWLTWQVVRDIRHPPPLRPPTVDGWFVRISALIVAGLSLAIIAGTVNACGGVPGTCGQGNEAWIVAGIAAMAFFAALPKLWRWLRPRSGERRP